MRNDAKELNQKLFELLLDLAQAIEANFRPAAKFR